MGLRPISNLQWSKYAAIYNNNIFMEVKNMHIDEMRFCNDLKVICNEEIDIDNKIKKEGPSDDLHVVKKKIYLTKNKKINEILEYRKTNKNDELQSLLNEINMNNDKKVGWIFY
jgi:hypothetical protein